MKIPQFKTTPIIGGIIDTYSRSSFFTNTLFQMMNAGTFYVVVRGAIGERFLWLNINVFFIGIAIYVVITNLIQYMFINSSTWAFVNEQSYKHGNPIKEELESIHKEISALRKHFVIPPPTEIIDFRESAHKRIST